MFCIFCEVGPKNNSYASGFSQQSHQIKCNLYKNLSSKQSTCSPGKFASDFTTQQMLRLSGPTTALKEV
jgi:hypothetical protein